MSYREDGDQVVLTMSREDYERLLMLLGGVMTFERLQPGHTPLPWKEHVLLLNRLNSGNPNYTPYQVERQP